MSTQLIQALHAGISRRDWSAVETAANRLRDEAKFAADLPPQNQMAAADLIERCAKVAEGHTYSGKILPGEALLRAARNGLCEDIAQSIRDLAANLPPQPRRPMETETLQKMINTGTAAIDALAYDRLPENMIHSEIAKAVISAISRDPAVNVGAADNQPPQTQMAAADLIERCAKVAEGHTYSGETLPGEALLRAARNGLCEDIAQSIRDLAANLPPQPQITGWQPIATAPMDKTPIIIAVPTEHRDDWIVGEAYYETEHYEGGDWWWAGTSHGDYASSSISDGNHHAPEYWQPMPVPPIVTEGSADE